MGPTPTESRRRLGAAVALAITGAITLRLLLGLALGPVVPIAGDDQQEYLARGRVLAEQGRFADPATHAPSAYRDPGYVVLLAGLRHLGAGGVGAIWLVHALLSAATGALLVYVAHRSSGARAAWFTALCFLSLLSFAGYTYMVLAEVWTGFLCALLLVAIQSWHLTPDWRREAVVGFALAAVVLTRSALAPMGVALAFAGRPRPARFPLIGALVALVCVGGWCARNQAAVGLPVTNTNGMINFYLGNNAQTPLVHSYKTMYDTTLTVRFAGLGEADRYRLARTLSFDELTRSPGRAALRIALRIPDAFEPDRMIYGLGRRGQFPERSQRALLALSALIAFASWPVMAAGLAAATEPRSHWTGTCARWALVALVLTQAITIAHPRFTMPGWLVVLPAAGTYFEHVLGGDRRAGGFLAGFAAILAVLFVRQVLLR